MKVLYFRPSKQQQDQGRPDHQLTKELIRRKNVAICQTLDGLFEQLRSITKRPNMAILCVNDKQILESLVEMSWVLSEISIVLLLPNQNDEEMIALAHKLRPRFIGFLNHDIGGFEAVVHRIIASEPDMI